VLLNKEADKTLSCPHLDSVSWIRCNVGQSLFNANSYQLCSGEVKKSATYYILEKTLNTSRYCRIRSIC